MKAGTLAAIVLLGLVALAHGLRLVFAWPLTVDGIVIPGWVSVLGVIVPSVIALQLWRESH